MFYGQFVGLQIRIVFLLNVNNMFNIPDFETQNIAHLLQSSVLKKKKKKEKETCHPFLSVNTRSAQKLSECLLC